MNIRTVFQTAVERFRLHISWKGGKLKVKFQQSIATAASLLMHVRQNEPNGIQNMQ